MIRRHVDLTAAARRVGGRRRPLRDRRAAPAQPAVLRLRGDGRARDARHGCVDRRGERLGRGAVHPHRARRPGASCASRSAAAPPSSATSKPPGASSSASLPPDSFRRAADDESAPTTANERGRSASEVVDGFGSAPAARHGTRPDGSGLRAAEAVGDAQQLVDIRAVAPHTVSSSSSKKKIGRSSGGVPQRSSRYVPSTSRSASGSQKIRSTSAACGVQLAGRRAARRPRGRCSSG